ncbi:MAG TPA: aspartate carbamoyltransferase [Planctomycetota bacterium]|nr:aspartate carbamoyltransferase [Planctomycetota bacterium]
MTSKATGALVLAGRDLISMRDITREELLAFLDEAVHFEGFTRPILQGKVLGSLFFEPSTRTNLSFSSAMQRLGGDVIGFADAKVSSTAKGESLVDTIRVVENYCDIMLIRHPLEGAARLAAESTRLPVINAGDGTNQHPTQTLLDLYTIRQKRGRLDNLKIAFIGDLKYSRTVHSLIETLTHFDNEIFLVSPPSLRMPPEFLEELDARGTVYSEDEDFFSIASDVDILYTTRIQQERFPDAVEYEKVKNAYRIDRASIERIGGSVTVMHPLPRLQEISRDLDSYPGSAYFDQARNGVTVRKAVLSLLLGVSRG